MADGRQEGAGRGDSHRHQEGVRANLQALCHMQGNGCGNQRRRDIVEHVRERHGHQHQRSETQHDRPAIGAQHKPIGEKLRAATILKRHTDGDHRAQEHDDWPFDGLINLRQRDDVQHQI